MNFLKDWPFEPLNIIPLELLNIIPLELLKGIQDSSICGDGGSGGGSPG
ncbi:MAG: hypothetical protein HXS43_08945 [Theionarchaea archaeon]|nr:hypothetical protein [Theionarchaea archaeon]